MIESDQDRASRYLRHLVSSASRGNVYSLGLELQGRHADVICLLLEDGQSAGVLVPVAKLLTKEEVAALREGFGAVLESDCAGNA